MVAPTGDQFEISGAGYRAVVTEGGAALRVLEQHGRPLVAGFGEDEMSSGGRGQLLMPWPNRLRDGRYRWQGRDLQLALTEPSRGHASHGLARWVSWTLEEHAPHSVSLVHRLMAQSGYPWLLELRVHYVLSADGLTVTQSATNLAGSAAPYASGAHPYLRVGDGPVDDWELTLPAATRCLVDDRLIPVGREDVGDTDHDFRVARPVRQVRLDDAFTDLERDDDGRATVLVRDRTSGHGVALWVDERHRWLQLYTGEAVPELARRAIAVEPMTAPANAFASGEDLATLEPGEELAVSWGIRALD
ncbi:aldose 1-epimerase family protein [uncultured Nocardioides sp.]|uniref:Aldose 1-epimerase n=1 Tax=uncultured Nocardioides sp. TaxID=198441 RepID=A0A6J4NCF6_9ACTN|nr:aldose 1-epimerase family protein [uncultured Nocardioides sp.]CAA9382025.1 MAG: Aldose 1-epimerase [uncultured Nocardioides sp.]